MSDINSVDSSTDFDVFSSLTRLDDSHNIISLFATDPDIVYHDDLLDFSSLLDQNHSTTTLPNHYINLFVEHPLLTDTPKAITHTPLPLDVTVDNSHISTIDTSSSTLVNGHTKTFMTNATVTSIESGSVHTIIDHGTIITEESNSPNETQLVNDTLTSIESDGTPTIIDHGTIIVDESNCSITTAIVTYTYDSIETTNVATFITGSSTEIFEISDTWSNDKETAVTVTITPIRILYKKLRFYLER